MVVIGGSEATTPAFPSLGLLILKNSLAKIQIVFLTSGASERQELSEKRATAGVFKFL